MKRARSVKDILASAKKKQYASYSPPETPWLAAMRKRLPILSKDFAKAAVAAWDGSLEDKCGASMRELLDYAQSSPWINVLVGVRIFPGEWTEHHALVCLKNEFWFAYYGGFELVVDDGVGNDHKCRLTDEDAYGSVVSKDELVYPIDKCHVPEGYVTVGGNPIREWIERKPQRKAAYKAWCRSPKHDASETLELLREHGCAKGSDDESSSSSSSSHA